MTRLRTWAFEIGLGARMSVAGGRAGWTRLALIATGVGIGVAVLLAVATLPTALAASNARTEARTENIAASTDLPRGDDTMLIGIATMMFRGDSVHGRMLQAEGSRPPVPPGVTTLPGPGEMLVSPALADLMADEPLLAQRWGARVVGTIAEEGLSGPADLAFYLGTDTLTEETGHRIAGFGYAGVEDEGGVSPVMLLLSAVGMVVLLMPVMVFMASAVRFGGEARDRRLAALRLVGADAAMTRRIAAGETLAGALLGLVVGAVLAVGAGLLVNRYASGAMSFYLTDMRPVPALVALIAVGVPAVAVLVTLSAMRQVVVQPLGVVRLSGTTRRRLWWRLILPVLGVALLWPLKDGLGGSSGVELQAAAGVALLLIGLALLLPWWVEATVHRLGGGSVAWELAIRRLQLDSGTAVRAVSGIAVSVAGVIALQGLVSGVESTIGGEGGSDARPFQHEILPRADLPDQTWITALEKTPGVREVQTVRSVYGAQDGTSVRIRIGDCAVLAAFAETAGCADGDVYAVDVPAGPATYELSDDTTWTPPTANHEVAATPSYEIYGPALLITPGALRGMKVPSAETNFALNLDTADPDAVEHLRNTVATLDPQTLVSEPGNATVAATMRTIRQSLLVGTVVLLLLIGASLVVNVAEQLRERRKVLAVLVAFGTRRRTLTGSVLAQAAVPVLIGMTLAVGFGSALAAALMAMVEAPVTVDWFGIGTTSGVAALVVLGTTAATLPTLMRLTRPGNLRSE
ncbi:FtsX-like permease family protein [Actinoplanes sp. NBRC 101535]|uniref:ABC transporter permease n=1 Tax=Actinoplanes sp. NBRC 101535 TaxID=3032196 RepID=UPI0024A23CAC|nr:FtsX-like permease family protein [Actinoplanes sp. NBRC 101535]GLY07655.1 membrane protein [Actinoplanes sp. NBRC 101535]